MTSEAMTSPADLGGKSSLFLIVFLFKARFAELIFRELYLLLGGLLYVKWGRGGGIVTLVGENCNCSCFFCLGFKKTPILLCAFEN